MSLREADVGITEFLGNHSQFRAILKQQLDDFIVNEIEPDGTVVYQKSRAVPEVEKEHETTLPKEAEEEIHRKPESPDYEVIDSLFASVSPKPSDEVKEVFTSSGSEYTFPPVSDKASRTILHNWVKANLTSYVSDTVEVQETVEKAVRIRKRTQLRPWKRRRRGDAADATTDASRSDTFDPRDSRGASKRKRLAETDPLYVDRKTYVSMTLWKKGRDTNDVLSILASTLRVNPNCLTHAGTKDKRAVTTQMIRLRGVAIRRLVGLNNAGAMFHRGRRCVGLGDFRILRGAENHPLSLGDLKGNRFTLVLRDISYSSEGEKQNILNSLDFIGNHGFINYFGLQRFGSGVSPTHETGYAVLRGDLVDACRRILTPLTVAADSSQGEKMEVRPGRKRMEEALQKFGHGDCTAKELLDNLPNWMAIERTIAKSLAIDEDEGRTLDYKCAFGKLPRNMKKMYCHAVQSYLWNCMASKRISMFPPGHPGREFAVVGDLVAANDSATTFNFASEVRLVTKTEEEAKSVPIEKVLIPVIGAKVSPPTSETGSIASEILRRESVDMDNLPADCDLKGTYRRLIGKAENLEYSFKAYPASDRRPLVSSNFVSDATVKNENEKSTVSIPLDVEGNPERQDGSSKQLNALIISFSLGVSSYATMLTRELTRSDSSSSNQKFLQQNLVTQP